MIFGDRGSFAIESEISDRTDKIVWGKLCLWVAGQQVGEGDDIVWLIPAAAALRSSLLHSGQRYDAELDGREAQYVLEYVHDALYGDDVSSKTYQEIATLSDRLQKLEIPPRGDEAFDSFFAVLLEDTQIERFIWWKGVDRLAQEAIFLPGEYERAVRAFLDWVDPIIDYDPLSDHFAGKIFVFSGHLKRRSPSEMQKLVRRYGAK